jgi:programmed cell death 6-interacting protein
MHARALRVLLESLDDVLLARVKLVRKAQSLAESDDIGPRILKVAASFERWVEVTPAIFAEVSDEELAKYDKFVSDIEGGRTKQEEILQEIKVWCSSYMNSSLHLKSSSDLQSSLFAVKKGRPFRQGTRRSPADTRFSLSQVPRDYAEPR